MSSSPPLRIAPSLLAADFGRLGEEIHAVEQAGADWLHVDVMDGHFVPNLSMGLPILESIKKLAQRPLDVHIMISNPLQYAERYVQAGADILTFHAETKDDPRAVIDSIEAAGGRAAMALNPDTPIAPIKPLLERLSMVLVMSVFPGFGGQKFMAEVLPKFAELRAAGFTGDLEIDGGIGTETIAAAAQAGANVFVAGTAIFRATDRQERMTQLRQLALTAATQQASAN